MRFAAIVLLLFCGALRAAELTIEITSGNDNPTSIAVVPFGAPPGLLPPETIDAIVSADLQRSGLFAPLKVSDMIAQPHDQTLKAIELLGTKVAPVVREEIAKRKAKVAVGV